MTVSTLLNAASDVVVLEERRTTSGHTLALATLNVEKTLNSLSLPMIEILAPALAAWNERRDVVAILLRGHQGDCVLFHRANVIVHSSQFVGQTSRVGQAFRFQIRLK